MRDRRAEEFESAALPHLHGVYRTAARLSGNRDEAQRLTEEVYLQAWKSFDRFEAESNCRAWLFKILFERLRHCRRRLAPLRPPNEEGAEETFAHEPPPARGNADEEVLAALERLPQPDREILLLADVEEFSYKEIASTLDIPVGEVMSRVSRARMHLRTALAPQQETHGASRAGEASAGRKSQ